MEDLISTDYLAAKLGCPCSDVEDALQLLGFEPAQRVNGRVYWPGHAVARVICYMVNSGRATLDVSIPAGRIEEAADHE